MNPSPANPSRTPPPATNPVQQPAQTYPPPQKASLILRFQPDPEYTVEKGQPVVFDFFVENTGKQEVRNVRLEVPLPEEYRGRTLQAGSSPAGVGLDVKRNTVVLDNVSIPPQDSVRIAVEYPTIDERGWTVTGEVFVNGVSAGKTTKWLGL
jgi:hypothetical protein